MQGKKNNLKNRIFKKHNECNTKIPLYDLTTYIEILDILKPTISKAIKGHSVICVDTQMDPGSLEESVGNA